MPVLVGFTGSGFIQQCCRLVATASLFLVHACASIFLVVFLVHMREDDADVCLTAQPSDDTIGFADRRQYLHGQNCVGLRRWYQRDSMLAKDAGRSGSDHHEQKTEAGRQEGPALRVGPWPTVIRADTIISAIGEATRAQSHGRAQGVICGTRTPGRRATDSRFWASIAARVSGPGTER